LNNAIGRGEQGGRYGKVKGFGGLAAFGSFPDWQFFQSLLWATSGNYDPHRDALNLLRG
jgi:hypothetical protein